MWAPGVRSSVVTIHPFTKSLKQCGGCHEGTHHLTLASTAQGALSNIISNTGTLGL